MLYFFLIRCKMRDSCKSAEKILRNYRKTFGEIDIIAEDEVDRKIEFIEVKRQVKNFDKELLKEKSEAFMKSVGPFKGYEIVYRGLSIEDM